MRPFNYLTWSLLAFICCSTAEKSSVSKWKLAWSDDFSYTGLPDSTKWNYDVGGHGWGNNELQFYTKQRSENARVEKGYLTIEARKEAWEGKSYTSARLITKEKVIGYMGKLKSEQDYQKALAHGPLSGCLAALPHSAGLMMEKLILWNI